MSALELRDAAARIGGRTIWANVSIRVERGQFVAVLGPNGAGKSTLVRAVLGLQPLSGGSATVLGRRTGEANDRIGYLPQRRSFEEATRIRGIDLVRLGLDGVRWGIPLPGVRSRAAAARAAEVIELVGATPYAERPIGELSGGEQQRLLIAQALARAPKLLILDEPLDSLDLPNQASIATLVRSVASTERVAVLLVAHDVNPLAPYLDRVVYLGGGRALAGSVDEVITSHTL
ncbi:MAG: metal ABC transporter ATP-binding protein, partial [Gaiellaceae bacterium]